jgi:8-oxo-dGTP pyrophosphatase MutT (NUDIX family)
LLLPAAAQRIPVLTAHSLTSTGIVILPRNGRIFIRKVAGGYGGYDWSFAKGKVKPGLSLEENALRELQEEMGLEARIVGVLGDYEGDTGVTRFFVGEITGGDIRDHGWETEKVCAVTHEEAQKRLNRARDRRVLDDLYRWRPDR